MSAGEAGRGADALTGLPGVLPRGTVLRGYEIKSVLGKGAFGITYRAVDTTLHRDVAIKEYLPTTLALREGRTTVLPHSPDHAEQFAWGRERFLEEARTLARLERTPGIVRVYDFLEANGTAYMVMALIEGETLAARLTRERRLTPEAVERLLGPLLDGLEEFHAATYLHRDIKPANIMVDATGKPTLIDFGASRAAMADRSTTMTAVFTPGYAAAEQFVATSKLGPSTDIYGLSATLYHAITGKIPPSAFERILKDNYEPLSDLMPEGYSTSLLTGIDAGLAIPAADRPQSIAEWRGLLQPEGPAGQLATRIARKPGPLARVATRTGRARITLGGRALWGVAAAAILVLVGSGYLAYVAIRAPASGTAALDLSAEQLEQALAERRKADAFAAEKKRLVEEAQRKADADAATKQRAETELQEARLARQKAEEELAKLKADIEVRQQTDAGQRDQAAVADRRTAEQEAQRKAEAEAVVLRQAEEEAQKKAAADAEAKRLADEALAKAQAEQQRADEEARQMAEAEATKRKADEEALQKAEAAAKAKGDAEGQKKVAEAAEKALRLEPTDRQRVQVALSSIGFDTRGSDGVFGPRSREMIGAWQKARNQPETSFLNAAQQQVLLKEASAAVGKFDAEQKKADEEKKAADEARSRIAAAAPVNIPSSGTSSTPADGLWRGIYECGRDGNTNPMALKPEFRVTNGSGIWYPQNYVANANNLLVVSIRSIQLSIVGSNVTARQLGLVSSSTPAQELSGRVDGDTIRASNKFCTLALTRDPSSAPAAPSSYDGTYTLARSVGRSGIVIFSLRVTKGSGMLAINIQGCSTSQIGVDISSAGEVSGQGDLRCCS